MSLPPHRTATREEWLRERIALLAQEKALTRERDALAAKVRALPWVRVEKPYAFETPAGTATLAQTVSRAPLAQLEAFRTRMSWRFPWVSSGESGFGRDFGVSFSDAELAAGTSVYNFVDKAAGMRELPGLSVFAKDEAGQVFHTYSTFARGLEEFLTAYRFIDLVPKGRDEAGPGGMGWVRHHDRYGDARWMPPWEERSATTTR
jgi:predicted dithiol-disulfide oxidoreductase (DUF899 family)